MENSDNVVPIARFSDGRTHRLWSFNYPHQVVRDPALGLQQKRAILAVWASDAHAVQSFPTLRHLPGTPFPVTYASIMDARKMLDRVAEGDDDDPPPRPASGVWPAVSVHSRHPLSAS